MKLTRIATLILLTLLSSPTFAQRTRNVQPRLRTFEGTVVDRTGGARWAGIVVRSGGRTYDVPIHDADHSEREPKIVRGDIWTVGTLVQVTYYNHSNFGLVPTRVVEVTSASAAQRHGSGSASVDSWQPFWNAFRSAVSRRDKVALKRMMASQFDWALDGYISPEEALQNIGKIVGWNKFWLSAKKAVATKPEKCSNTPSMNNHSGYCVYARSPFPMQLVFERGSDGNWYWSAFPGD